MKLEDYFGKIVSSYILISQCTICFKRKKVLFGYWKNYWKNCKTCRSNLLSWSVPPPTLLRNEWKLYFLEILNQRVLDSGISGIAKDRYIALSLKWLCGNLHTDSWNLTASFFCLSLRTLSQALNWMKACVLQLSYVSRIPINLTYVFWYKISTELCACWVTTKKGPINRDFLHILWKSCLIPDHPLIKSTNLNNPANAYRASSSLHLQSFQ